MGWGFLRSRFFGLLCPLGLLAVGSLTAHWCPPFVSIGLVFVAGAVLFFSLSNRLCTDPRLMWIVGGSYLLRSAIAIFLFAVSASQLPIFPSLQLGDGFWQLAPDARGYHERALSFLDEGLQSGWIHGLTAHDLFGGLVGWVYWWFTPHPLVAILFNVWAATGTTLLAFGIGRHIGGSTGMGLASAVFVGFWPSTLIWSAQLLKDPLFLFLLFVVFSLVLHLLSSGKLMPLSVVLVWGTIFMTAFLLTKFRPYSGWVLLGSCGVAGLLTFLFLPMRQRVVSVGCFTFVGLGVLMGVTRSSWLPLPSVLLAKALDASSRVSDQVGSPPPSSSAGESQKTPSGSQAPVPVEPPRTSSPTAKGHQAPPGEASTFILPLLPQLPTVSLSALQRERNRYVVSGGNLLNPEADISTPEGLLRQLPAALGAAIFAPYPWRWSSIGDTGVFRGFAAVEVILLILLLPGLLVGSVAVARRRSLIGWLMLVYGVLIWFLVALVVANEGSMFRIRLQGVLPVVVVAIGGGGLRIYARFLERLGVITFKPR